MALITISGEPGCRHEDIARMASRHLGFEMVTESRLNALIAEEFGDAAAAVDRVWPHMANFVLVRLAGDHHLVVCCAGAGLLLHHVPSVLRVHVIDAESKRLGAIMIDRRLERPAARQLLRELEAAGKQTLKKRFGRTTTPSHLFDLVLNAGNLDGEHLADLVQHTAALLCLQEQGKLSPSAEAQLQFQNRLQLAKHGIAPAGKVKLKRHAFVHPSEEIFAHLLDFYRIAWEYEPRSFPIQWDRDGKVLEAFTPDFYLSEFDLYVELTTMKQSLVTKKNRKVKLLRSIYPHINIQVFYQKDIQNLIFKYGLAERPVQV